VGSEMCIRDRDMLLYIATGVFFLFAMDTFVTLGKRMR
jgi:hypothetical protein